MDSNKINVCRNTFYKTCIFDKHITGTSSKWTTFDISLQNMEYAPYLAEWPIELKRPSLHIAMSSSCFISSTIPALCNSQWRITAGKMNCFCCRKYVLVEYAARPICLKTSKILLIDAPAVWTAKLNNTFPAGWRPSRNGCEHHLKHSTIHNSAVFIVWTAQYLPIHACLFLLPILLFFFWWFYRPCIRLSW